MTNLQKKILSLIKLIRPFQWVKNLVCFAGLLFSGLLFDADMLLNAILAFAGFSFISSSVYILNDCLDIKNDRLNPRTATRPVASGEVSIPLALAVLITMVFASAFISSRLSPTCLGIIFIYFVSNVAYSLRLKKTVIADVMSIALGFVLRVLYGVYAVRVSPSPWIILCMFFLALFLGFGKRRGEIHDLGIDSIKSRSVLSKYTKDYLDFVLGITGTITIISYTLFSLSPHHDATMVVTVFPVVYCVLRYAHQIVVEGAGQSPERLIFTDKMLWIGVASWVIMCVSILYFNMSLIHFPK